MHHSFLYSALSYSHCSLLCDTKGEEPVTRQKNVKKIEKGMKKRRKITKVIEKSQSIFPWRLLLIITLNTVL